LLVKTILTSKQASVYADNSKTMKLKLHMEELHREDKRRFKIDKTYFKGFVREVECKVEAEEKNNQDNQDNQ